MLTTLVQGLFNKHTLKSAISAILWLSAEAAQAQLILAQQRQCLNCHQISTHRIGPPFQAIAQRYAPAGEVMIPVLARKIRSGGKGAWGQVGMPAMTQVSDAEAQQLARWILQLR